MRSRKIAHHLTRAATLRAGGGLQGPQPKGVKPGSIAARIEWHESEAERLLIEGLKKRAARHPRTKYALKAWRKNHGTGTGSGAHNRKAKKPQ